MCLWQHTRLITILFQLETIVATEQVRLLTLQLYFIESKSSRVLIARDDRNILATFKLLCDEQNINMHSIHKGIHVFVTTYPD